MAVGKKAKGTKGNNSKKGKGKAKKKTGKKKGRQAVDIYSTAAMENAYFISHNIQDCLQARGFSWPGAKKKKKKSKKKKSKK